MRLWHKDLITVLPRKQLIGQWRECCAAAKSISEKGTPNHLLVNKIMDYPLTHFSTYCIKVHDEMIRRGFTAHLSQITQYVNRAEIVDHDELFKGWHNRRYLEQCLSNLQEKFDCGGISIEEWHNLVSYVMNNEMLEGGESDE